MVRITTVAPGSRAARHGVRAGDILVSINGRAVKDVLDYRFFLADTTVVLGLLREGEPLEITTFRGDGAYSDHRHPDEVRFTRSLREDLARRDFTMNAIAMDARGDIADPFGGAGPREEETGVGDARGAGVAHQRDVQPAEYLFLDHPDGLVLVELVVRKQLAVDVEMLEKHGTGPGVLGKYQVRFTQDPYGPHGHVLEISHRSRNDI